MSPKTVIAIALLEIIASGCSLMKGVNKGQSFSTKSSNSSAAGGADTGSTSADISSSVPVSDAVVGRIIKGLPSVSSTSGNFKAALGKVQANLPDNTDPEMATGLDQIPILVYAACADVKASVYSVDTTKSISVNMNNLVNAGITMVNQHVGGLASSDPYKSQVTAVFTKLINDDASAGATTSMTFISVCLAANAFGVAMTGY